jgi:hypothetical protein
VTQSDPGPRLRHVIVAGGRPDEWGALAEQDWITLLTDLGKVADQVGADWLTLRPWGPGPDADGVGGGSARRELVIGTCVVTAQPEADGRARVAAAVETLRAGGGPITEESIGELLDAPATADADLVVVLGSPHVLPPSLVWELAYSELVFIDIPWRHLSAAHLEDAFASYGHRHRRFGGLDPEID